MEKFFCLIGSLLCCVVVCVRSENSTLELVHVLFRHGDRNPDTISLWESNPYYNESFYKGGYGQLTNEGKRTEYKLGTLLRARYDEFLGSEWDINIMDVRTTDYNRTKMSALLVMAGLWPPTAENAWLPSFAWQPIPYNYVVTKNDKELSTYNACSKLDEEIDKVQEEEEIAKYLQERYNRTYQVLQENTGITITPFQAFALYLGLLVQEQLNFPLEDWTQEIYPEPLHSAAVDYYYLEANNTALRRIVAGYFLKLVFAETESKINGTLNPPDRKMYLYSAHENNIATLLISLEAFQITDIPPYGSYVLMEVHQIEGVYGFKLFYQDYEQDDPIAIKLPNCDYFCPYDEFYQQVEYMLPESDADCNAVDEAYTIRMLGRDIAF
ncbi:venom acid phosphatase Acph-1-like [Sitophilus oryzae]|uniref:acid phosphatase n=1 Tax=Sitophilus oryzae TaxID=7048 RepID=A0A6J2Y1X0_SITOR|nr:venom acid phosphatase Acph-1-like [Sitophilus oryzae]